MYFVCFLGWLNKLLKSFLILESPWLELLHPELRALIWLSWGHIVSCLRSLKDRSAQVEELRLLLKLVERYAAQAHRLHAQTELALHPRSILPHPKNPGKIVIYYYQDSGDQGKYTLANNLKLP